MIFASLSIVFCCHTYSYSLYSSSPDLPTFPLTFLLLWAFLPFGMRFPWIAIFLGPSVHHEISVQMSPSLDSLLWSPSSKSILFHRPTLCYFCVGVELMSYPYLMLHHILISLFIVYHLENINSTWAESRSPWTLLYAKSLGLWPAQTRCSKNIAE